MLLLLDLNIDCLSYLLYIFLSNFDVTEMQIYFINRDVDIRLKTGNSKFWYYLHSTKDYFSFIFLIVYMTKGCDFILMSQS